MSQSDTSIDLTPRTPGTDESSGSRTHSGARSERPEQAGATRPSDRSAIAYCIENDLI
ncbi:hypothetical protein A33M_2001 [Rhodovulum sp. PH10]|uniref:hypothetical protein n=1 Tax=Rhodovulum sp. PH10 TaxID=1187851 RepID=UPI00027C2BE8|nr:hypothetical protein [Rhodovulum sp. PH10]EJW12430.1 hypothetical protein A33M_2001 [Rhodovulum sp. PH10]